MFILRALQRGADGVIVAGCHPGECHYSVGNLFVQRKLSVLKEMLESLGIEKGRLNFAWLSSAEAERFVKIVNAAIENVKAIGPAKQMVKVS